jgi:hypothetical protein
VRHLGPIAFTARGRLERWVLFVRSQVVTVGYTNFSRDTIELVRASGTSAVLPIVNFISGDFSFYDHFGRPDEIAWR